MRLCREIGDRPGEASGLIDLGLAHLVQGAHREARRCWGKSVAICRSLGLDSRTAYALHNLGILYIDQGDPPAARNCLEESLAIHRAMGAKASQALDLGRLAKLHLQRGDYDEAGCCLDEALALEREAGGDEEHLFHLALHGGLAYETGRLAETRQILTDVIERFATQESQLGFHDACAWLASTCLAQGDGPAALAAARQGLAMASTQSEIGELDAILGSIWGSGLSPSPEDPLSPSSERWRIAGRKRFPLWGGSAPLRLLSAAAERGWAGLALAGQGEGRV